MPISEQQWQEIENRLKTVWRQVELDCDGYLLTLALEQIGTFQNAIWIYVDGQWKGCWALEDCEQRRRFFCRTESRVYRKNDFEGIRKSTLKLWKVNLDKTITQYRPYWTSFARLRSHLEKNNTTITLIEEKKTEAA